MQDSNRININPEDSGIEALYYNIELAIKESVIKANMSVVQYGTVNARYKNNKEWIDADGSNLKIQLNKVAKNAKRLDFTENVRNEYIKTK